MKRTLIIALLFAIFSNAIDAQITAPGMRTVRYTNYGSSQSQDPIFVYCVTSGTEIGTLVANDSRGSNISTFVWSRWNASSGVFEAFHTDSNVDMSQINNVDEGGYRVAISDPSGSETFTCWVFLDKPFADAKLMNNGCDYVALDGTAVVDTFYYYDPVSSQRIQLQNAVGHLWSSDPSSSIPYPNLRIDPYTYDPPLEDVTYKLTVTDSMTCVSEASFFYESIHVKAKFSADVNNGEATLDVNFRNESIHASNYEWNFGDDSEISDLETPETHTFYKPGVYTVTLSIESDLHCMDSDSLKITVKPSSLAIPNAFTPNEDGYNDRFMVDKTSLKRLDIQIFSSTGVKVYGFSGDTERIRNWEGWDGNINNSTRKASPGVYYYIIKAVGWDDEVYDGREYRGFLYLYR